MAFNPNWPAGSWPVSFDADPNDPTAVPTWDDLTNRIVKWDVFHGRQYELANVETGTMHATARNDDEALSPGNPTALFALGAKELVPYRQLQHVEFIPGAGGNWINDTNAGLLATPMSAEDASFENGTLGHWIGNGTTQPVLTNDATHVFVGTKAMKVHYAAAPVAFSGAALPAIPVFAGVQVTWAARVYLTANLTVAQCNISGVGLGGSTSTLGSYQVITQTWTPTYTGSASLQVIFAGTGAGDAWIDAVMLEFGAAAHTFTSTGPTLTPVATMYIDQYLPRWTDAGFYGWCDLVAYDALALLSKNILPDVLTADILQDAPGFSYPLTDAAGVTGAANNGPVPQNPLTVVASVFGAVTFGTSATGPGLDSLPGAVFTAGLGGGAAPGAYLTCALLNSVGGNTQSASFELWFKTSTLGTQIGLGAALSNWNTPASSAMQIYLDSSGHVTANTTVNGGSTFLWTLASPGSYTDGAEHHVVVTEAWSGGTSTVTLYVDGVSVATTTGTTASAFYPAGVMVGWIPYSTGSAQPIGTMGRVAFYPTVLSAARVLSHFRASTDGFAGDLTGARVQRILTWVGWNGQTAIDAGSSVMQGAMGMATISARDMLQRCADTDLGMVFASPAGAITFYGRDHFYLQTQPVAVFGENLDAGEIPYMGDISFALDTQFIANQVTVDRNNGATQYLEDAASKRQSFPSPLTWTTYSNSDADALALCQHLLNTRKNPRLRTVNMSVEASKYAATAFPTVLTVKIGDRVRVNRRPPAGLQTADFFVQRISRTITPDSYLVAYQLTPVDSYQAWILGDSTYGVLGASTIPVF